MNKKKHMAQRRSARLRDHTAAPSAQPSAPRAAAVGPAPAKASGAAGRARRKRRSREGGAAPTIDEVRRLRVLRLGGGGGDGGGGSSGEGRGPPPRHAGRKAYPSTGAAPCRAAVVDGRSLFTYDDDDGEPAPAPGATRGAEEPSGARSLDRLVPVEAQVAASCLLATKGELAAELEVRPPRSKRPRSDSRSGSRSAGSAAAAPPPRKVGPGHRAARGGACPTCGRTYRNLKDHKYKVHAGKRHACSVSGCESTFARIDVLKKHEGRAHRG